MKKMTICAAFAAFGLFSAYAQSGTNSPYSQYGVGSLSDRSQGFGRGMNGVGLAFHKGNVVNTLNPASYACVDSLTMLFDVGLSGQITNFKEGSTKVNARNSDFEYAVGSFRLLRGVGFSFGILPFSAIGYEYSGATTLDEDFGTVSESYKGSGGLHQAFVGIGWNVAGGLSVGANVAYLWGTYSRSITSSSNTYVNSIVKSYSATVNNYTLEAGVQWQQQLSPKDQITIGATMGLGHSLKADASCQIVNGDTTTFVAADGLRLPMSYGVGLGWTHGEKWFVGADFTTQRWGSVDFPDYYKDAGNNMTYALRSGLLKDSYKVNIGADYVPNAMSQKLLQRVHYRMGIGYATPYYYINGHEGPKELSVSAGFGIPLQRIAWNARGNMRPLLNISAQWARSSAKDLITENTFRINLGLTFNERWFAKWKVD